MNGYRLVLALSLAMVANGACPRIGWSAPKSASQTWQSSVTGNTLAVEVLASTRQTPDDAASPLVIYLKNLAAPRVGTESDSSIIADLRAAGNVVAIVDYKRHSLARVPALNRDLGKMRDDLRAKKWLTEMKIDENHIFIVPAGSRVKRDVIYYNDANRAFAMDVVYPSRPRQSVGAILEFSCDNQNRMGNTSLSICGDTVLDAEATEGFAVAMADHPVPAPYKGLDPMPECGWKIKAAVRTLRSVGKELGLNGKIVPFGFSRGSGMALMLATTRGLEALEKGGEHPEESSAVQGAVVLSGRFTYLDLLPSDHMLPRYARAWGERETNLEAWRQQGAIDYLTSATVPLYLSINRTEGEDAQHQMIVLRKRLAELGNDEVFRMESEARGHKVPIDPTILNEMNDYFKSRLH